MQIIFNLIKIKAGRYFFSVWIFRFCCCCCCCCCDTSNYHNTKASPFFEVFCSLRCPLPTTPTSPPLLPITHPLHLTVIKVNLPETLEPPVCLSVDVLCLQLWVLYLSQVSQGRADSAVPRRGVPSMGGALAPWGCGVATLWQCLWGQVAQAKRNYTVQQRIQVSVEWKHWQKCEGILLLRGSR